MRHEASIIKLLAALTAAPRWVTALVIADGTRFLWGDTVWWAIASACLSVLFAGVETYAASFIMRAWHRSTPGSDAERVMFGLWLSILATLVVVMAPAIYSNTMRVPFADLPAPLIIAWSVCVAASTFLVIGGVGYAERLASPPQVSESVEVTRNMPARAEIASGSIAGMLPEPRTWRQLSETERAEVVELTVDEIMERYHVSERTARNWRAH